MRLPALFLTTCFLFIQSLAYAAGAKVDYLHLNWIDKSINPAQDFYEYANGNWQKNHPIPSAYSSWDIFLELHQRNQAIIKNIIESSVNDKKPNQDELKIGNLYYSGMDVADIDKLGVKPLLFEFDRINSVKDITDLQNEIAHLQSIGVDALFNFSAMPDFKHSQRIIGVASQGGLSLPDRDYYLKNSKQYADVRKAYLNYMITMFQLLGDKPADATHEAHVVLAIETNMARASLSRIQERDPFSVYHILNRNALLQLTPNFSWQKFFADIHHRDIQSINVAEPTYFQFLNYALAHVSLKNWKIYLRWHLLDSYSVFLSRPFVDANFQMLSFMTGTKNLLPRWRRVVNTVNSSLGFAVGKIYVEKYFPASSKEKANRMIATIRAALKNDLQHLPWMSDETRAAALKKLSLMQERVGYPTKWWDYSSLQIDRGPYVLNMLRISQYLTKHELDKIGKPMDTAEWDMTPQTINAYYDASMNRINVPAGILQPPFFNPDAPDAVNYGAIGFVIGHEMTHGFDDDGSQFDGKGNLNNWWTTQDLDKFKQTTNRLAKQFSSYVVAGDHVQGKLVTGEATADLGGLILAYRAFHATDFKNAKDLEGFTPDQQFFLSAAHVWATNMRRKEMRRLVITDPHPPAMFRVNGTFANMPQFKNAFHIASNSPMTNTNKIKIW